MEKRRYPRVELKAPVRIYGTDASGHPFSENVFTVNICEHGARLSDVNSQLNCGETIGLAYEQRKNRFQIRWIGENDGAQSGHIGLSSVPGQAPIWDVALPPTTEDGFRSQPSDRRTHFRVKCFSSVELHPEVETVIWGKTADMSLGGCFVEMATPLKQGTPLRVGLWVGEIKLWIGARVVSRTPGYGIGLQFTEISGKDAEHLKRFLTQGPRASDT